MKHWPASRGVVEWRHSGQPDSLHKLFELEQEQFPKLVEMGIKVYVKEDSPNHRIEQGGLVVGASYDCGN
jgi:hypothetical protein